MGRLAVLFVLGLGLGLGKPPSASGQEVPDFIAVGEIAPDIQLTGATRHGVLKDSIKLSDLRGETVVLAFFFRARTGG